MGIFTVLSLNKMKTLFEMAWSHKATFFSTVLNVFLAHFERFFKIFHLRSRGQPWRLSFSFFLTLMLKLSLKKYNMNGVEILPFDKKDCARLFFNIFINTKNHVRWALFLLLFQPISIDFKSDRGWIMLKSTSTQTGKIISRYLTCNYFTFNTLKA